MRELIEEESAADLQPHTKLTKHRESGLDQSWQEEFVWVLVDEDKDGQGMYCSLCRKHNQTTVWI